MNKIPRTIVYKIYQKSNTYLQLLYLFVQPQITMSFNLLPVELFLEITDYLAFRDLVSLSKTSHQLQHAVWVCLRPRDFLKFAIFAAKAVSVPADQELVRAEYDLACVVYHRYYGLVLDKHHWELRTRRGLCIMFLTAAFSTVARDMSRSDLRECVANLPRYRKSFRRRKPRPLRWPTMVLYLVGQVLYLVIIALLTT
jgi:hypothetical protein